MTPPPDNTSHLHGSTTAGYVSLTIADVVYRGRGLARLDGQVVFVPDVLPGEIIEAVITCRHKKFSEARLTRVVTPSPHRVAPACPLAGTCPGCAYQHAAYTEELRLKHAQFRNFLERQAHVDPSLIHEPVASPEPLAYRNKISLHVAHADIPTDPTRLGYVGEDNFTVIDILACPLAVDPINQHLARLRADPAFMREAAGRHNVTLRWTPADGVFHRFGRDVSPTPWLTEATAVGSVHVPRGGFFQMNPSVANLLVTAAIDHLRGMQADAAIDLYGGVGVFGIAAHCAGITRIIGIDADPTGIEAAIANAREHGLKDPEFMAAPAAPGLRRAFHSVDPARTALIVDPPRTGLDKDVIKLIAKHRPLHMLYVSCAPDTLARDLVILTTAGYRIQHAQLFDMFPRTPHFESITVLRRT